MAQRPTYVLGPDVPDNETLRDSSGRVIDDAYVDAAVEGALGQARSRDRPSLSPSAGYRLTHPVYLDVQMMVSFLAHLEGGVATHEEETKTETGARERALRGRAGFRLRLPSVFGSDASAEGDTHRREETFLEAKAERHHTAASLFNLLYAYLTEDEQLVRLQSPLQLDTIESGQLVEVSGEYLGNPLEDILAFFGTILPYVLDPEEAEKAPTEPRITNTRNPRKSGNPARRAAAQSRPEDVTRVVQPAKEAQDQSPLQMILRMAKDIEQVPVHDLLLQTEAELRAVLTVSSEYYSAATREYLRAGEFHVIGIVTRVLSGDRSINLTRRTVLGAAGPGAAQELIDGVKNEELGLEVADPIVKAPAVQILPMAIFL